MLELMVEPHAGSPLLLQPLSGHRRDAHRLGELVRPPIDHLHTTYGLTSLAADSALSREANRATLSQTQLKGLMRVPAPVREAPAALAQVNPQTMMPRSAGDRCPLVHSTAGRVAPRWADRPWLKQRDQ